MATISSFWIPRLWYAVMETAAGQYASDAKGTQLLDNNPDSHIVSSSATTLTIRCDVSAGTPTNPLVNLWGGVWVFNPADQFPDASANLAIKATTESDYSSLTTLEGTISFNDNTSVQHILGEDFALDTTRRYYQFEFTNLPAAIDLGMIFIGGKRNLEVRWNWDAIETTLMPAIQTRLPGGRILSRGLTQKGYKRFIRRYELISDTDINVIRAVWNEAKGPHVPFILTDNGDDPEDGWLVRFAQETLGEVEVANGLWNVTLRMDEVPYIPDGEVY